MIPRPGESVGGKYRITRLLGDGGMGVVFEARHELLGTPVALKFLHAELARRPGLAERFLQEARVSASIQSPHVTRVSDVDRTVEGSPFLVMELLVGETLQQLLDRERRLGQDRALDFTLQILAGLQAAHAMGVVHRDLKPDNVFVTSSTGGPLLKLIDFGIAKVRESSEYQRGLTRAGALMGTPEYMAPEQLYGADRVDHRADLFSAGVILYELLTGTRPTRGEDAPSIAKQVMDGRIARADAIDPSLPEPLADVVARSLAADPSQRFQNAAELARALAPFAGVLSHAGRLAATPVPNDVAYPAATPLPPAAAEPPSRVARTWPPEAEAAPPAWVPAATAGPRLPAGTALGAPLPPSTALGAPVLAPPQTAVVALPQAQHSLPQLSSPALRAPPRPAPRRSSTGLIVGGLLLLATATGIALVVLRSRGSATDETPIDPTLPRTELTPKTAAPPLEQEPLPTTGGTARSTAPTRTTGTVAPRPRTDGGTDPGGGTRDGGSTTMPPFGLPSGFPALPTGFPTAFPSSFPPLPGFGTPPASSQ